jgi:hypothetical protein
MKSRDVSLAKMTPTVLFPAPGIPIKTMLDLSSHKISTLERLKSAMVVSHPLE